MGPVTASGLAGGASTGSPVHTFVVKTVSLVRVGAAKLQYMFESLAGNEG